jgi:leucyl aminopeptidase
MDIKVSSGDIVKVEAGAVIVGLFDGAKKPEYDLAVLDKALAGQIAGLIEQGEIKGCAGEVNIIHSIGRLGAARVAVVGLGKEEKFGQDELRRAVASACRVLLRKSVGKLAVGCAGAATNISAADFARAVTEGALLGVYEFRRHMTKKSEHAEIRELSIIASASDDKAELEKGVETGVAVAEAAILARDMVNEPANYMNPSDMAATAAKVAKDCGLELTMLEKDQMEKLGMGALLAVSRGSHQPPKFIILSYSGRGGKEVDLAIVGKGITFDSGGISIKPSEKMEEMKTDMAGGASVLAAIGAIAKLKVKANVTAIVPAVENLPGGDAYRPGDVLTAMNGSSVEVISTDAEGRLILADALAYAESKLKAKNIVDVATLTGACIIALGRICTGAFTNNQGLMDKVLAAARAAGEPAWQMPMFDEYKEQLKSDVADVQNVGGRSAGAITGAAFLEGFVGDTPWVHLDIAGTSTADKESGHISKGATGVPVATLVNLALSL